MSWTSPRTWVVGEVLTAALLNTHLRDNLKVLADRLYAAVNTSQNVSSANNVYGDFSTAGPSVTIVNDGDYDVFYAGTPGGNTSAETATLGLMKNGSEVDAIAVGNVASGSHANLVVLTGLVAGDVIKLMGKDSDSTRRIAWGNRRLLLRRVPA